MKRLFTISAVLALALSLASCGGSESSSEKETKKQTTTTAALESEEDEAPEETTTTAAVEEPEDTTTEAPEPEEPEDAMVPGILYQIDLEEGEEPLIKGISLTGNISGSFEEGVGINARPTADKDIRSIFETNEWVSVYVDSEKAEGLGAYAVPHEEAEETFLTTFATALEEGFAGQCELVKPEEEASEWGSFYINPEEWDAGYYDLVFTDGQTPVARILLRFYPDGELSGKSDADLTKLMEDEAAAAEAKE